MGRFRFQFHLSTAVVMMLVASVLLGWNMAVRVEFHTENAFADEEGRVQGWPFTARYCEYEAATFDGDTVQPLPPSPLEETYTEWRWGLAADIAVALAIIVGAGVFCEWLVRRRAVPADSKP